MAIGRKPRPLPLPCRSARLAHAPAAASASAATAPRAAMKVSGPMWFMADFWNTNARPQMTAANSRAISACRRDMRRLFACLPVARNRVAARAGDGAVLVSAVATDRTASAIGVPDAACRRPLGLRSSRRAAGLLQRLHDAGLVRPPQLQGAAAVPGHAGVLGHRLHRVLPGGAGQSLRPCGLFGGGTQDHPGGRDADRVRGLLGALS